MPVLSHNFKPPRTKRKKQSELKSESFTAVAQSSPNFSFSRPKQPLGPSFNPPRSWQNALNSLQSLPRFVHPSTNKSKHSLTKLASSLIIANPTSVLATAASSRSFNSPKAGCNNIRKTQKRNKRKDAGKQKRKPKREPKRKPKRELKQVGTQTSASGRRRFSKMRWME